MAEEKARKEELVEMVEAFEHFDAERIGMVVNRYVSNWVAPLTVPLPFTRGCTDESLLS